MKSNRSVAMRIISASLLVAGLVTVGTAQRMADPERRSLLVSAANAYYNARELGLSEFSCVAKPDWASIIGSSPANAEGLKILNAQHFYLKLNAENNVELIHKSDFPPPKEVEKDLKDLYTGMQEMTTGFFALWSAFALRNPFPEPGSNCEVLSSAGGYEIRCDDPSGNVVTVLKKDFSITEIRAKAAKTTTIVRPVFNKTPEGFIMAGYDSDAEMPDGSRIKSHVEVGYDGQEAYRLPVRIKLDGGVGNERVKLDLILSDYQVIKKKS
jgi:hypothetical protein